MKAQETKPKQDKKGNDKKKGQALRIKPVRAVTLEIEIIGVTPLLTHRFSSQTMDAIEAKQAGAEPIRTEPKKTIDPETQFRDALYLIEGSHGNNPTYGIKGAAFLKAMAEAALLTGKLLPKKTVLATVAVLDVFIALQYESLVRRRDDVRVGNKRVPRHRPEFKNWRCILRLRFLENYIRRGEVINLLNLAGVCKGVGDWRPERGGSFGQFMIGDVKAYEPPKEER